MRYLAPWHRDEAIGTLSKSQDSPESAGRGETGSPVTLLAARKKGSHSGFSAESGDPSWLDGCARRRWSWNWLGYNAGALRQRCGLAGVAAVASGKQRKRKEERRRRLSFIGRPRKQEEDTSRPSPRQREAKGSHSRTWNAEEGTPAV